ncbi:tetraacyldisaccharide 4'-kinase [Cytophaga aurantiaca]|uniref:tetraacyldisaccharide 4'-kinase n=1 Tax=Cytophaga aurantiaca TaxID=29530 RepID=UPI000363E6DD|nr:tetraacyldisaccharide 4'-kinase [Cytophaga aurantiaca]
MIFLKILLWPFSILYGCIVTGRNKLYDLGLFTSTDVPVAVVCVGNLKAGGTGKTPFTQYLLDTYSETHKTAVLSRGYGRKTRGFVLAQAQSTAVEIGDEPLQLFAHAQDRYHVAVCEDRIEGVKRLLELVPDLKLVILDDGFQHRKIKRDVNVLLTEYNDPFYTDMLLPSGRLRESRISAARADVIVVTKTPPVYKPLPHQRFISYIKPRVPVHYTGIIYGDITHQKGKTDQVKSIILVTGIANTQPLVDYLKEKQLDIIKHFNFSDHYSFSLQDIEKIENARNKDESIQIVTTEKDWVKIVPLLDQLNITSGWNYLPISLGVFSNEKVLLDLIQQKISKRLYSLS